MMKQNPYEEKYKPGLHLLEKHHLVLDVWHQADMQRDGRRLRVFVPAAELRPVGWWTEQAFAIQGLACSAISWSVSTNDAMMRT